MTQAMSTEGPKAEEELHVLGRLSRKFPQKAVKRAVWAFSTPPRLEAPALPEGLEPVKSFSREGLRLLTWGGGGARKVLLVHGWGLQALSMHSFVPGLLAKNFEVIAFDGPAHGESPGGRVTGADFARSILALTDEYQTFDAIIGHSVGGAASSIAVGAGADIKRLALLAPAYLPEIIDGFCRIVDLPEELKPTFIEQLAVEARWPLEDWSGYNLAHAVQQPVEIYHDPADKVVSLEHSQKYVEMAANAVLHEITNAGHNSILHQPHVIKRIVEFVAKA